MVNYTDTQLETLIVNSMKESGHSDAYPALTADDIISAAFVATLIGIDPMRYLRVAEIALRHQGYRKAAALVKSAYRRAINEDE